MASILVVDDELGIREGCRRVLTLEGHEARTANSAEDGLQQLRRGTYDLVLMDVKMPGMTGIDMLDAVHQSDPDIVCVMVTGYATLENAIEGTKRGAYDFLPKPFTPDELMAKVGKALDRRQLLQEARRLREERERNLLEIATEKTRLRTVINCMVDGVLVTNREGQVVLHNPASLHMLAIKVPDLHGRPLGHFMQQPGLTEAIDSALAAGKGDFDMLSLELTLESRPDMVLMANVAPIRDEQDEVIGAVLALRDISKLKELDRVKSQFVSMVSHELRAPLGAVQGYLDLFTADPEGKIAPEEKTRWVNRCKERVSGLLTLVDDLLDVSRIEAGRVARRLEPLSVAEVVRDVVGLHQAQAQQQGIAIGQRVSDGLPLVMGDREDITRAITNLASNAVKYNRAGGTVEVSARTDGAYVCVDVADTGIGIPPVAMPNLFEEFFRVKSPATRGIIGTGLGLSIVRKIAEAHHGHVEVKSELGKGSTFSLLLPVAEEKRCRSAEVAKGGNA